MKSRTKLIISSLTFVLAFFAGGHGLIEAAYTLPYQDSCAYQGGVSTSMPCGHTISVDSGQYITSGSATITVSNVAGNVSTSGYIQVGNGTPKYFSLNGNGSVSTPTATARDNGDQTLTLNFTVTSTDPNASQAAGGGASFNMTAVYEGSPNNSNSGGACDGDGVQESNEQCDGADFNGQTCDSLGYNEGTLNCNPNCTLNLSQCRSISRSCGNGIAEASEQCDGNDFRSNSCQTLGYGGGTLNCNANCTWLVSACVPGGGGGSGGAGNGDSGGNQSSNLAMQICKSGLYPPTCGVAPEVDAGSAVQLVAWYSTNGGGSWSDYTNASSWSLSNEGNGNYNLPDYDFNSSCSAGYCLTARGVRYSPVASLYNPSQTTAGAFHGVVTNTSVCSTNASGCPSVNANYSGTSAQVGLRVVAPPTPPPPPAFDYTLSNGGNTSVAKSSGANAYAQNTITQTLTTGTGQLVSLTASGVPSNVSYSFSSSCTPTCSSTITFTVSPSATAGTYPITITGNPLGKTTSFNLIISNNPISVTCTATPNNITLGQNVVLSSSVSGGNPPYRYSWYGTGIPSNPVPTTTPYNIVYTTIGPKTARVSVLDNSSQQAECQSVGIQVNFDPQFEEF